MSDILNDPAAAAVRPKRWGAFLPALRVGILALAVYLAWYIAGNWNRWTGAARIERTDDAYIVGDVTPLAAKVSGYILHVGVSDNQRVETGDLIAEIEPSDYRASLALAEANLSAAQAALASIATRREVQHALITQAQSTIEATQADLDRYNAEAKRQHDLLRSSLAGTLQLVEQADSNEKRTAATLSLNKAQLEQQKAVLAGLDVDEKQATAQVRAAEAQRELAQNNLRYTRIVAPANGMVAQRQVRPGQFANVGTQIIAFVPLPNVWVVANYKETQMTNVRVGNAAAVTVDAFPNLRLKGHVESWSPGTGSTFTLLPPDNATGNFTKVVQRIPVKIVLDADPALGALVRPGMSVVAAIDTGASSDGRAPPSGEGAIAKGQE